MRKTTTLIWIVPEELSLIVIVRWPWEVSEMLKSGRVIFRIYQTLQLWYSCIFTAILCIGRKTLERTQAWQWKLFNANHISGVVLAKISTDLSYIKGFCVPETRQSADPCVTCVLVHKDGWIRSGGCTCMA